MMGFYADRMRTALTLLAGDWITRHGRPRMVVVIAFVASFVAAHFASTLLLSAGLSSMALRFTVCFALGYFVFLLALSGWYLRMPCLESRQLLEGKGAQTRTRDPSEWNADDSTWGDVWDHLAREIEPPQAAAALAAFYLLAAVIGTAIVAIYWIYFAPWYLGQLLVLGGKVRHRSLSNSGGAPAPLALMQQTKWIAVILGLHYLGIGIGLQLVFPQAVTIADVVRLIG